MGDDFADDPMNQIDNLDKLAEEGWEVVLACRRGNRRTPVPPRCKQCGKTPLKWAEIRRLHNRKGWELQELDGSTHVCDMTMVMPNLDENEKR